MVAFYVDYIVGNFCYYIMYAINIHVILWVFDTIICDKIPELFRSETNKTAFHGTSELLIFQILW